MKNLIMLIDVVLTSPLTLVGFAFEAMRAAFLQGRRGYQRMVTWIVKD